MNIVCCIKQVPAAEDCRFDPEKGTLIREGLDTEINPYDLFALEAAVRLKEACGGRVTVISMGPPQAEEALRDAISRGADHAILLSDPAFAGSDTLATSYILAKAVETMEDWDMVLCGKQTTDGDTAQVGPGLSVRLGCPCITCVTAINPLKGGRLLVTRRLEEGDYSVEVDLPLVLTVEMGAFDPRVPSLKGKMRARKAEIPVYTRDNMTVDEQKIGLPGSPTRVDSTYVPEFKGVHEFITGSTQEQVAAIMKIFKETGI